jgi:two-component system OmpR family response regulator
MNVVLDHGPFERRLEAEVARVRRRGGFLSLVLIGSSEDGIDPPAIARRLNRTVRLQDVVGLHGSRVAVLLPDTSMMEAAMAGERFLRVVKGDGAQSPEAPEAASAGVAAVFGGVEGGPDALFAAACEAVEEAAPGQVVKSRSLEGRPRVLIVDDDLPFAQALSDTVAERGWEAHPCTRFEDACQRARDGGYDALFVDLMLAPGNGVEVVRRAIAKSPRRPVVLMSGSDASHQCVLDALELGPVTFVAKPISTADLDKTLQMLRDLLPGTERMARRLAPPEAAAL